MHKFSGSGEVRLPALLPTCHLIPLKCRMGIQALPYLARVPPSLAIDEGGALTLNKEDVMPTSSYPWSAETIATWVLERTGVAVGEIKRPTLVSTRCASSLGVHGADCMDADCCAVPGCDPD